MPLLQGVISDLQRRFTKRQKLPYPSIRHFKEFETSENTIKVKLNNVAFTGLETFAFLLMADRLIELRPAYKDTFSEKISIEKFSEETKFKSLSDEDVWFSHLEIPDDHTLILHFLVLTFSTREQMKEYLESG